MLRTIIEKEILENILTLRFITAFILCIGLVTISAFVLSNDYAQQLEDYHARVKIHAETANPELINVDRRPSGLGAMFSGMVKESAQTVRLMIDDKPEVIEGIEDNPMFTFFPTVDLTFIIGVVMSLLAILFAYDAIAGEREAGTLALIASNAVKRNTLLLGKWLGGFVSLIIPCFASLPVSILIIHANPMIMLNMEDWQSLYIIFAITLVYLSAFFSVGILISCIAKRSSTAGLMLLFLWAIFVFVIPNISPYAARAIYPIPPHSQIVRQEKLLESDIDVKRRQRHETAALDVIEKKLSKEEAFQIIGQIQSEWLKEKKQRLTNMDGDYLRKVQRQEQIAKEISSISPYACFTYLVNGLANTDAESHERFLTKAARFDGEYFSIEKESNEKPRFHYEDAAVAERSGHSLPQLIILLLLNGLFLILGFVVFLRADVTK